MPTPAYSKPLHPLAAALAGQRRVLGDVQALERELAKFSAELAEKPRWLVIAQFSGYLRPEDFLRHLHYPAPKTEPVHKNLWHLQTF